MRRRIRATTGIALAVALGVAAPAQARPDACDRFTEKAMMSAFEYAFEASTEGELAEAPDLYIDVDVHRCRPESRRRASFRYSLRIMDKTKDAIVREKGTLQVTRRRATFEPSSPGAPALSTRLLADASW